MDWYNTFMTKKSVTRLYESFAPENYYLTLEIDPTKKAFSGSVVIKGRKTGRPSRRLTFHQKDLKILNAHVRRHDKRGDEEIKIDRINTHKTYDEVRLHSPSMMYPGVYTVTIAFEGKITDPMNGLYPCYFNHDGKDKILFATQFESHHAREVFPCIDEPEAKATFDLALIVPEGKETVLANTPVKLTDKKDGKRLTVFEQTPIMSTYLLAFAYGDVRFTESKTKRGTDVRVYATPDNVAFTDFALDTAVKVLEFYEDYFDIPYPLAKCDMIALPDFASGAMENWGLITYREQTLLVDPKNTSLSTKQYVAMVVAHELAHQWFGNLVTMEWWTDLWLNEGFASWIEYLAVDHLYPDWDMWTQFVASEQQAAFKLDALDNTHPIEVPINHPDEIRSIFDAISYNKGASVIHMLHGYLGADDFRDGLRHYLKTHAYKNTKTMDLWAALEKISGKPVKEFMHAWTSLPGFPIVSAARHQGGLTLSQERFYMQKPTKIQGSHWPIPLLTHVEGLQTLETASVVYDTSHFEKINRGQSGFYRVDYEPELTAALAETVSDMEPLDRLGLLSDAFDTAKAGYSSAVEALNLLAKYENEDNAAVWDIIASNIGELRRVMDDDELRELLKPLIIRLTTRQVKRLGFEEKVTDSHFDKLLRPTVIALAASADEPEALAWCLNSFKSAKSAEDIHADLRSVVFSTAARKGDAKTFDKLLGWHNETNNSEERVTLSAALTSFEQAELIEKALDLIPTKDVRRQDAMYWLAYSFMNRHAKRAAWKWMQENWSWLDKELGSDLSFYRTPIYAGRSFSSEAFMKEYDAFFADKSTPALERSIKQGREMLEWQTAWRTRDLKPLLMHLSI